MVVKVVGRQEPTATIGSRAVVVRTQRYVHGTEVGILKNGEVHAELGNNPAQGEGGYKRERDEMGENEDTQQNAGS